MASLRLGALVLAGDKISEVLHNAERLRWWELAIVLRSPGDEDHKQGEIFFAKNTPCHKRPTILDRCDPQRKKRQEADVKSFCFMIFPHTCPTELAFKR